MTALAVTALLAWLYLVALHGGFWRDGERLPPARPAAFPPVAAVVPARDEAGFVAASVGSLLAQDYPGPFRVVLVDDGSTDGTAAIARTLAGADRLTGPGRRPPSAGLGRQTLGGAPGRCRHPRRARFSSRMPTSCTIRGMCPPWSPRPNAVAWTWSARW